MQPEGQAERLFTLTVVLSVLCTIIVPLRVWCRLKRNSIGVEDWLMCTGYVGIRLSFDNRREVLLLTCVSLGD